MCSGIPNLSDEAHASLEVRSEYPLRCESISDITAENWSDDCNLLHSGKWLKHIASLQDQSASSTRASKRTRQTTCCRIRQSEEVHQVPLPSAHCIHVIHACLKPARASPEELPQDYDVERVFIRTMIFLNCSSFPESNQFICFPQVYIITSLRVEALAAIPFTVAVII